MEREAMLYHRAENGVVICDLCQHRCRIAPGKTGICRVRHNAAGRLESLVYGHCISMSNDPIEKKPLFHFLPGSHSVSVATIGCNFRCAFCQNWQISQAAESSLPEEIPGEKIEPQEIVDEALRCGAQSISYTYTEPTIFFEYAYDTAVLAHNAGIANVFVSNGYMTPEAIDTIAPYLDAINVDLKAFNDKTYRQVMGGTLQGVLQSIKYLHQKGIWMEVTTLIVPGMNDSAGEVRQIAHFIANISPDIPWHVSRFFPQYRMENAPATSVQTIAEAVAIGHEEGLRFVYSGNMADSEHDSTWCPECRWPLIKRVGYRTMANALNTDGKCPGCGTVCPGVWSMQKLHVKA